MVEYSQEFKDFLKSNKDNLLETFEEYYNDAIPDIAQSYGSFDELQQDAEEEGFEYNEYDWYNEYSHVTGNHAEWEAAEWTLQDSKLQNNEDTRGYLIEFLGYRIGHSCKNFYYKEER